MAGVRLDKPWRALTASNVAGLAGELGVYQLADVDGKVVRIGYAGGRSLFGLRSELQAALASGGAARQFRTEVTAGYMSRYDELLMVHVADFGSLPEGNAADARRRLGRLTPG
jgi:hypothetical protein